MYEQNLKFGQTIIVCGSRPCVGTSTAASIIASYFAAKEDKTLLLSTDYNHPYDAISLLSDIVADYYMDEMVALENSSGLTPGNFDDYASYVSDNLAYSRLSTKLSGITKDVGRTLARILDTACRVYRYVVLDLDYQSIGLIQKLVQQPGVIVYLFGQDFQSLKTAEAIAERNAEETAAVMLPVLMNCMSDIPVNEATLNKIFKSDVSASIEHDTEIFKSAQKQDIAEFVFRGVSGKQSGLKALFKRKSESE
ncbi:MAG: hypothetical protein GXY05_05870, partial [Clostridiales bacterium]|nr:hypothetical protein [Clostridiales bacterium]